MITVFTFLPTAAYSVQSVRVALLPFEIYSQEELGYLQTEIPEIIGKHLETEGALVIDEGVVPDLSGMEKTKSHDQIRNLGRKAGADYVVWGSLTVIGRKISLDARMIDTLGQESPGAFFAEGEGLENLFVTVRSVARDLGMKLFKREKVARVVIEGNRRIEDDAVKRVIRTKPGDIYLAQSLTEDLKRVYAMGYFEDVRVEVEEGPQGKIIIFKVKEKPTVKEIRIKGNTALKDEKIKEGLSISAGSILNISKIHDNIKLIEELYKDKNYHNVKVAYNLIPLETNRVDLEFVVAEGEKVLIKEIALEGNNAYADKKLKKMMKTSEKGFFSWLTSSGELDMEDLSQDVAILTGFYHNNGYLQARVGEPQVEYQKDSIYIKIKIDEGRQFKIGAVDIEGDLVLTKPELLNRIKSAMGNIYSREVLRNDVLALTDLYSDESYAYAEIFPRIEKDFEKLEVNITFVINKGNQVYFEKIIIGGNTKTRDKVIRRELNVYEQELYSGQRLKRGVRNLHRLDYFEDIKVNTSKGSADDTMVLKVDVTEKPTGVFSFGGGYSSQENLFVMASVSQRNLFGRGQTLQLKAELGSETTQYSLSFTEPWLFDIPLSAGFDLYNWEKEYEDYDKDSVGGGVRFGYSVFDYTRAYLSYSYDIGDITNVDEDASESIREMEGTNVTSSVTASLRYDSRNRQFNPTEGSQHSISVEYAGFGGDIAFTKYRAETGWYIPLFWNVVGFLHGKTGYVHENPGGKLPDWERFNLGGINSLRGFEWEDLSPKDEIGAEIGGDKFVQFNFEFLFPLLKKAGIVGVLFYDTGDVYDNDEHIDLGNLRQSAGYGFRWYSPMGPIRIEYGHILDPKEGEDKGKWEFTMGTVF
jgi:outer membrane protein insertion porin family